LNTTVPQYRKVYETLRKHIENGEYSEGDILPSENELCVVHQVTRPTVRKALDILTNEGYIKKRQGLGSVVQKKPKGIGILSLSGTTSAVGQGNLKTKVIVKPVVKRWPENFVFELSETELESGCIYFERLRLVDNSPIFYDVSFLPNLNLPRFTSRILDNKSLFNILREIYHVKVTSGEQFIEAIKPNIDIQKHLKVTENTPILNLQRKMETNRINFNIYSFVYCDTSEHKLFGRF
jgi:DNA-binding GntR family transcriptional regulator